MECVIAVDGGAGKTDLAVVGVDGALLSLVRGGGSSPHYIGVKGCIGVLSGLLGEAGVASDGVGPVLPASAAQVMVAGADLPEELAALRAAVARLGWSERLVVDNDTFAVLRSGTDRGWGVGVVCGSGINCIGVAPDGREVRFPSLGPMTGDWGGGYDFGLAALGAAARSADGRGPQTMLERAVPGYFGLREPFDVARALHLRELPVERLGELGRVVFPAAEEGDAVAAEIVGRLGEEVVAFAVAALRRLELTDEAVDVVLGGGLIRALSAGAVAGICDGVRSVAPRATVVVAPSAPIVGAVLLALDAVGGSVGLDDGALARAQAETDSAFAAIEGDGSRVVGVTDG